MLLGLLCSCYTAIAQKGWPISRLCSNVKIKTHPLIHNFWMESPQDNGLYSLSYMLPKAHCAAQLEGHQIPVNARNVARDQYQKFCRPK